MDPVVVFFVFLLFSSTTISSSLEDRGPYIIHMDKSAMPAPFTNHQNWYTSLLSSLSEADESNPAHLYTYHHVVHGFSAVLSTSQLEKLEQLPGHLATYPDTYAQLHTTHTPQFLGLKKTAGLWPAARFGDDVIIGIFDTGVWPESEMFNDQNMSPVPKRWKGKCETGTDFNSSHCNRKLIGARSFTKGRKQRGLKINTTSDYDSPRDFFGHGTHTSSTAAGSRAPSANYFGYAKGTAVGMAPMARVAMYKVIFKNDTFESAASDVLAGMDQAISDGVDLMSLSLGFPQEPYYQNAIALGAFAAMEKGIFVSCSAGNEGSRAYTIKNGAPWITTVGASTIDRDFAASITLGQGIRTILGKSIFPESIFISGVPIYHGHGNKTKEICDYDSLDPKDVAGKVLFCTIGNTDSQRYEMNRTGAIGGIFASDSGAFMRPDDFFLPFALVSVKDGEIVKNYIEKAGKNSTVEMKFQITVLGTRPAPQVSNFSSRGPSRQSPGILKPDIVAPGVDILAAWVPNRGFARVGSDYLLTDYAIASGTSMSSPHVVGVAALLRSAHRDWSSAAIRSALMTTADITDNTHRPILDSAYATSASPLDIGSGHINPNKAMDPGLIYDIDLQDYIDFLCGLNYSRKQTRIITRKSNYTCIKTNLDLNYPSFIVILNRTNSNQASFTRTLTSVVDSPSVYRAIVKAGAGMKVVVEPIQLSFEGKNSKQQFSVKVDIDLSKARTENHYISYGYLSWHEDRGEHVVRSPIASAFAHKASS